MHGFIDGYSRLITGLRASNNNRALTVLDVFLEAAGRHRVPSRLRGDHGTENLRVAEFMEDYRGVRRGSYIWGRRVLFHLPRYACLQRMHRSVHNVRIERLWEDTTLSFGEKWHEFFTILELEYGLNINNRNHIWLLQYLFLADINGDIDFFVHTWNHHRIQIRNGPNRSPIDMFGFDMLVHGERGDDLSEAELAVYGVDWEALRGRAIPTEHDGGLGSWVGRVGPPDDLSHVELEPVVGTLTEVEVEMLFEHIQPYWGMTDRQGLIDRWVHALAFVQTLDPYF